MVPMVSKVPPRLRGWRLIGIAAMLSLAAGCSVSATARTHNPPAAVSAPAATHSPAAQATTNSPARNPAAATTQRLSPIPNSAVNIAQALGCPARVVQGGGDLSATNVMPLDSGALASQEVECIMTARGADMGQIYVYVFGSASNLNAWTKDGPLAPYEGNGGGTLVYAATAPYWVVDAKAPNDSGWQWVQDRLGGTVYHYDGYGGGTSGATNHSPAPPA